MGIDYDEIAELFFARIRNRLHNNNQNWLSICCGETGSGKSYSAMAMAKAISPRFNIKNIVFSPEELLRRITDKDNLKKGDVIIFDEAGVGLSARDWYSIQNKLLASVLQTFRNMNLGVIFTTPNLSFIDVQARKLFHNYFETIHIDRKEEVAYLKCYNIQHNSRLDKTYYKHPRIDINSNLITMEFLGLGKVDKDLIEAYEDKKTQYTEDLNQKALYELTKKNEKIKVEKKGRCKHCGKNVGYMTNKGWKCRECGQLS